MLNNKLNLVSQQMFGLALAQLRAGDYSTAHRLLTELHTFEGYGRAKRFATALCAAELGDLEAAAQLLQLAQEGRQHPFRFPGNILTAIAGTDPAQLLLLLYLFILLQPVESPNI